MAPDPAVTPDGLTAEFQRAIEQVRTGIQQIIDGFNRLVGEINEKRWLLGGAVLLWIKEKLEGAQDGLRKIIEKARYTVEHSTPVVSLILTSFDWLNQVQKPASAAAGRVPVKGDKLVYWKGQAADAYTAKLPFQQAAASDMATKADFISTWLFTIAKANVDYAVKMGEYISLIAGAVTQAAVDAASVFGLIEAINAVADAAGDLVEKALNQLFNIANRVVDLLKNARDATASINNVEKLSGPPAGTWPQAVNVG
ncbi:hypothetical protein [Couchioplanes azureus]|uniref:hypothetical protein n=1 Tax=Couchioplanes caeruleus TaxID=56438 RepID=UPI00166F8EC8|nr:hypothetical protein [Couchioplanes caeruleus]GGQ87297.1 hypothetical protein GCM10010166_66870 [Couchioplanes caeruleus subsp. azureus]